MKLHDEVLAAGKETLDRQQKKGRNMDNNELQVPETSLETEVTNAKLKTKNLEPQINC